MDNLLFTALTLATLYYFLVYLPEQKQLSTNNQPLSISRSVQTDPDLEKEKELTPILDELIKEIRKLNQAIK